MKETEKKKYPCEHCIEGTYMTVEERWWCNKHLMYACGVERSRDLCDKFKEGKSSVTPAPKKGKWIKVTNGRGGHEYSLCHSYAPSYQNGDEYLSTFCPNCGSLMVEEV